MTLGGVTPLAQGGKQILGTVDGVDVSATMHDKFQQSSLDSGWCLSSVPRQSGGLCRYATETGTHSVKLRILGWIDMPVVVHVEVVGIPVVAQRLFPLVKCSRPLRFPSCIPLIRCSTSLLRRSSYSRVQAVRNWSRTHSCTRIFAWTRSFTRPLCATTDARWFRRSKTVHVPQLQYADEQ